LFAESTEEQAQGVERATPAVAARDGLTTGTCREEVIQHPW